MPIINKPIRPIELFAGVGSQAQALKNLGVPFEHNEVYRIMENNYEYRIRKLTPKECWRLMGWDDESFHKAEAVNSNTQLYKQAGNGIVVPVLEAIFRQMLI